VRTRSIVTVATVVVGALAMGVAPAGAAKKQRIACTIYLTEQPGGSVLVGADKGPLACSSPFGDGSQTDTFKMQFNKGSQTNGTGVVKFKETFKGGTVSGTWKLTFNVSGIPSLAFAVKFTGGTGVFKGITGSGKGSGHLSSMTTGTFTYVATV
jgi:hypothetical protein